MTGFPDPLVKAEAQQLTSAELFPSDRRPTCCPVPLATSGTRRLQGIYEDPSKTADLLATFDQEAATEFGR